MKKQQNAESFAWIIVWVFILSFVVLGIVNILTYSIRLTNDYEDANRILILKQNISNAVKRTDTSMLEQNELFYLHKNRATSEYEVIRPDLCTEDCQFYRYIDAQWNTISDITSHEWDIYSHLLWVSTEDTSLWDANQIIRASISKLRKK